jgi:hypothetical protein
LITNAKKAPTFFSQIDKLFAQKMTPSYFGGCLQTHEKHIWQYADLDKETSSIKKKIG